MGGIYIYMNWRDVHNCLGLLENPRLNQFNAIDVEEEILVYISSLG